MPKTSGLNGSGDKSMVVMFGGAEESVCEISVDRRQWEPVSEFMYLRFMLDQ